MFACGTIESSLWYASTPERSELSSEFHASRSINDITPGGTEHNELLTVSTHVKNVTNKIDEVFAGKIEGTDFKLLENL